MRIAQIAPLWERVPPPTYGGIELIVSLLTDELVRRNHQVTLFATGDSRSLARLESCVDRPLRSQQVTHQQSLLYHTLELERVFARASEFDLIHSHVDAAAFNYVDRVNTPTIHTIHGIVSTQAEGLWRNARQQNFISISNSQRREDLELNYLATVYNGIDTSIFPFYPQPDDSRYLAFLGRIAPEKGSHLAIEIAKRSGWRLKMAGKVDLVDRKYFAKQIEPQIDGKQIEFLGEANHKQKCKLMGNAVATLFPITWSEPFGLVMAESMIVGTPVIAMAMGSTEEVVENGKTGFLCHNIGECLAALDRLGEIDRRACRDRVIANFSVTRMVDGYEAVYQKLLAQSSTSNKRLCDLVIK